jgi:hypothetical protein
MKTLFPNVFLQLHGLMVPAMEPVGVLAMLPHRAHYLKLQPLCIFPWRLDKMSKQSTRRSPVTTFSIGTKFSSCQKNKRKILSSDSTNVIFLSY